MATTEQLAESPGDNISWVKEDWIYIKTAIILAVFTGIEVFTYFESVHQAPDWLLVLTLSFLMVIKFFLVAGEGFRIS